MASTKLMNRKRSISPAASGLSPSHSQSTLSASSSSQLAQAPKEEPSLESSEQPACKSKITPVLDVEKRENENDLSEIANAVLMLIVEGRLPTAANASASEQTQYVAKEGKHASLLIDKLVNKIYVLNSESESGSGDYGSESVKSKLIAAKLKSNEHLCVPSDTQCQIASKLKLKIEKCMLDHLQLEQIQKYQQRLNQFLSKTNFYLYQKQLTPAPPTTASNHVQLNHSCANKNYNENNQLNLNKSLYLAKQQYCTNSINSNSTKYSLASQLPFNNINNNLDADNINSSNNLKYKNLSETFNKDSENKLNTDETNNISNSKLDDSLNPLDSQNNYSQRKLFKTTTTTITVDVYLLAGCCFDETFSKSGDNLIDLSSYVDLNSSIQSEQQQQQQIELDNNLDKSQEKENTYQTNNTNNNLPYSFELLERWSISMITNTNNNETINNNSNANNNNTKSLLALNQLFQAIRSYLHFSQISSWINKTKGQQPKNIAFSVNYSSEKDLTPDFNLTSSKESESTLSSSILNSAKFNIKKLNSKTPNSSQFDFQTFPTLNLLFLNNNIYFNNNQNTSNTNLTSTVLRVNLYSRKRQASLNDSVSLGIPQIYCNKLHENMKKMASSSSSPTRTESISPPASPKARIKNSFMSLTSDLSASYRPMTPPMSISNSPFSSNNNSIYYASSSERKSESDSNDSLLNDLFQNQEKYFKSELLFASDPTTSNHLLNTPPTSSSNSLNLFNSKSLITTPTTFPSLLSFPLLKNSNISNNENESDSAHNMSNFISQSPKVLVSNHQLVVDLCSSTQNNLKINDQSSQTQDDDEMGDGELLNNNKRKLNSTNSTSMSTSKSVNEASSQNTNMTVNNLEQQQQQDNESTSRRLLLLGKASNTEYSGELNASDSNTNETKPEAYHYNGSVNQGDSFKELKLVESQANSEKICIDTADQQFEADNNGKLANEWSNFEEPMIAINNTNNSSSNNVYKSYNINLSKLNELKNANGDPSTLMIKPNLIKKLPRSNFPLSSSPAPIRKFGSSLFDFDNSLRNPRSIKNALSVTPLNVNESMSNKPVQDEKDKIEIDNNNNNSDKSEDTFKDNEKSTNTTNEDYLKDQNIAKSNARKLKCINQSTNMQLSYSNSNFNSMAITPNCLLGSFEESLLNGRMNPVGIVDGFYAEIGASGSFFPEHATLPVNASFYQVCEDIAASPYLGVINLSSLGKRGYKVPNKGTIQVTLFNPNNTVVKMFVVMYDLSDMPANHRTFLRQRTMYVPLASSTSSADSSNRNKSNKNELDDEDDSNLKSYLRYLIHLRFSTTKSGKMYLHTNIKLIFARNKCEIDPRLARYEYKTFTEAPKNPKYSPKK